VAFNSTHRGCSSNVGNGCPFADLPALRNLPEIREQGFDPFQVTPAALRRLDLEPAEEHEHVPHFLGAIAWDFLPLALRGDKSRDLCQLGFNQSGIVANDLAEAGAQEREFIEHLFRREQVP